jgi:hypothetical protein
MSNCDSAKRPEVQITTIHIYQKKLMKNICVGYMEENKWETTSESGGNPFLEEGFTSDEVFRTSDRTFGGERPQNARNTGTLRVQNGKSIKRIRTSLPLTPLPPSTAVTRAYFRSMRAAEMAAWEMTGGDYVLSCFVTQA